SRRVFHASLADRATRRFLEDFIRRRVPAADVDDVVQTVLCDALAASPPEMDEADLRRWLIGIARHKVADRHRKASRDRPDEVPDIEAPPPPLEERSLVDWAQKQIGEKNDAAQTLDWMAREGEGDKLERIAADANMPAARVRQRVSRMRRWMKQ